MYALHLGPIDKVLFAKGFYKKGNIGVTICDHDDRPSYGWHLKE